MSILWLFVDPPAAGGRVQVCGGSDLAPAEAAGLSRGSPLHEVKNAGHSATPERYEHILPRADNKIFSDFRENFANYLRLMEFKYVEFFAISSLHSNVDSV